MSQGFIIGEPIVKSTINNSTSKQSYSFGKATRFGGDLKKSSSSQGLMYNLPSSFNKRSTSLGVGDRMSFGSKNRNAPPFYNLPSDFDSKKAHGFSFGISREYYKRVFIESSFTADPTIPGPGTYNQIKPFGFEALKFSIIGRPNQRSQSISKQPGPGEYPVDTFNPTGHYPLSQNRNATNIIFAGFKDKRFKYSENKMPGPGHYESKSVINGSGLNFNSQIKSSPAKSIIGKPDSHQHINKGIVNVNNKGPGPGAYNIFSEFGMYDNRSLGSHSSSKILGSGSGGNSKILTNRKSEKDVNDNSKRDDDKTKDKDKNNDDNNNDN